MILFEKTQCAARAAAVVAHAGRDVSSFNTAVRYALAVERRVVADLVPAAEDALCCPEGAAALRPAVDAAMAGAHAALAKMPAPEWRELAVARKFRVKRREVKSWDQWARDKEKKRAVAYVRPTLEPLTGPALKEAAVAALPPKTGKFEKRAIARLRAACQS